MSFVGLLHKPNLLLFDFTFGDVKRRLAKGAVFLFRFSEDSDPLVAWVWREFAIFQYTSGLDCACVLRIRPFLEQQRRNRIGFESVPLQVSHSTLQDMDECAVQPYS